jgi:segregation and condensation protein A
LPKFEVKPKLKVVKVVSLEEMITSLTKRVQSSLKMSFKDFSGIGKAEKVNVIVSFLAMLELVKQGIIEVNQREKFDDIQMETKNVGVPSY